MSQNGAYNGIERRRFNRYFTPVDIWAMAFGCMVGWGAFVMPGTTFLPLAGPAGTLLAMVISVAIMLVIACNYEFLIRKRPGIGGVYAYTKEAFGRDHAFICSWFVVLSYLTIVFLNATALFIVIRTLFGDMLQVGLSYEIAGHSIFLGEVGVSAAALACVGLMFIRAKAVLQRVNTVLAVILLAGTLIVAAVCLPHVDWGEVVTAFGTRGYSRVYAVFTIVILAPWAFVGFEVVSLESTHFDFPLKKSKKLMFAAIFFAGLVYAALVVISIVSAPDGYGSWQEYLMDLASCKGVESVPAFYSAREVLGAPGLAIMGITAMAAILTGMIGAYRAATRMLATMAEDHILSEKFTTTTNSIMFIMVISIFIAFLGRNALDWFVDLTSFGAVVGFGYASASAYRLNKSAGERRIALTGAVGTVISIAFAAVQLIPRLTAVEAMDHNAFLLLALWCLLGFIFYLRTVNHDPLTEHMGISMSGAVLFAMLLYSMMMWFLKRLAVAETMDEVTSWLYRGGILTIVIIMAGLAIMLYIQDHLRKRHERLEREKIQAEERGHAASQFLFNMSHDIRTPMNAIIGYTHLAKQEEAGPALREYIEKIDISGNHLLALINDVLEMSRIEAGKMELAAESTDIVDTVSTAFDMFRGQMDEKEISYALDIGDVYDRMVMIDRNRFLRVVLNLLSNAFKFTPEGGSVTVRIRQTSKGTGGSGDYEIRVEDTGIGMTKEFAEQIFEAFSRERTSTVSGIQGTGLGMAISKSIVDAMGGRIMVDSEPGRGTKMIVDLRLPISKERTAQSGADSSGLNDASGDKGRPEGRRLLLVEDMEINRQIAQLLLENEGFAVDMAANGREAVDILEKADADLYDAVLMDVQMPVMNGYEATKAIRRLDGPVRRIPIIAVTANAFEEDMKKAYEAGMNGHVSKPIDVEKIKEVLEKVTERSDRTR